MPVVRGPCAGGQVGPWVSPARCGRRSGECGGDRAVAGDQKGLVMTTSNNPRSQSRRQFLRTTGGAALAAGVAPIVSSDPAAASPYPNHASSDVAFGPVRQLLAGVLNVGYVELGPAHGTPVVLLHGFPYDIHSYERVAPLLAERGYRII